MSGKKLRALALGLVTILSTGCATERSAIVVCPSFYAYTPAARNQAVEELKLLPQGSIIEEMLKDYFVLREQLSRCQG